MQNQNYPPIVVQISKKVPDTPYYEDYLARYHQGHWQHRKIVTRGSMEFRGGGYSHDMRWEYASWEKMGTFVRRMEEPKFKRLSEKEYVCVFSPDNRYLLGNYFWGYEVGLFDLERGAQVVRIPLDSLVETMRDRDGCSDFTTAVGWYPEGKRFWYYVVGDRWVSALGRFEAVEHAFGGAIGTRRLWRLSGQELLDIKRKWDLLVPRFRVDRRPINSRRVVPIVDEWREDEFIYSWNLRYRLRARHFWDSGVYTGRVFFETREGRSQEVAVKAGSLRLQILCDLSEDGKWALWTTASKKFFEPAGYGVGVVLMHVPTGECKLLFEEVPGVGYGYMGPRFERPEWRWLFDRHG